MRLIHSLWQVPILGLVVALGLLALDQVVVKLVKRRRAPGRPSPSASLHAGPKPRAIDPDPAVTSLTKRG